MDRFIEHVRAALSTTAARWTSLATALPDEMLSRPPAPGEWTAVECLQHLLDTERMVFPARVEAFLAGRDFDAFDPDAQGTRPEAGQARDAAAEFARLREASLELVARLRPEDLQRTARHSELGIVTLEQLLNEWVGHDLMHTVQAERALMQPFIAGCGPWRSYFADHDVGARG